MTRDNINRRWGLKVLLASVLLFFLVAVSVEGRAVPFVSLLTPENTGRSNANNRDLVGQAYGYLAKKGRNGFSLSALVVTNAKINSITRVQLYNNEDEEYVESPFTREGDFYTFNQRIDTSVGESFNVEKIELHVFTKKVGENRPALSGVFVCNRGTFLSHLVADEVVTAPTGTKNNHGFVSGLLWSQPDNEDNSFLSLVVNHDLSQEVSSITLSSPAASNTENTPVFTFSNLLEQGGKALNVPVNASVKYWLLNHLGYVSIQTRKNPTGAIRGQLIPTTSPRGFLPTLPPSNGDLTFLPEGNAISGDIQQLKTGGARNTTGEDDRVCVFLYNATSRAFDNDFRFKLPVTLLNKYSVRSAVFQFRVAAEANDTNKFTIGVLDLNDIAPVPFFTVPGNGRTSFVSSSISLNAPDFSRYLGPGGLFITVQGSNLQGLGLFVDQFWLEYYVANAYATNIVKSLIFKNSPLKNL